MVLNGCAGRAVNIAEKLTETWLATGRRERRLGTVGSGCSQ